MLWVALVAVVVGACLQRASGAGVGLVVSPVLALLFGPALGVLITNATTVFSGALIMVTVRRDVNWTHFRSVALWAVPGAFVGAWIVRELSSSLLQIVIGSVVILALAVSVGLPRLPHLVGAWPRRVAGLAGGVLNTTAGIAAPAMVIHANAARTPQQEFVATMQPIFATLGLLSVTTKSLLGSVPTDALPPWWMLPALASAVVVGARLGALLARVLGPVNSRRVAMVLAFSGGTVVLLRGLGVL